LADLRAGRKRLDDVFLRLTGEASSAAAGVAQPDTPSTTPDREGQ
jgi:ABC-2 type transport system ATP-binding protein